MLPLRIFLRRHRLWIGFLAAIVPLLVLLALQYVWLVKLEKASAIAQKMTFTNYLEAVATEIKYAYRSNAERALNLPAAILTQDRIQKAAWFFKKKEVKGAKRLFVYSFLEQDKDWPVYYYDPHVPSMEPAAFDDEARAIFVASAAWRTLAHKAGVPQPIDFDVDERDPRYRMILNPLTDEGSRIVGVAGMIVDEDYLRAVVLPAAVEKSVPSFFADEPNADIVVTVRDRKGSVVYSTAQGRAMPDEVTRTIPFIFTDLRLGLRACTSSPETLARSNFLLNLSLSGLIAVVLTGGITLALRTASREMRLSEMKADFVSNVSHELRTPLASIRVFGEFMKLGRVQTPEKVHEYGEYIEAESRRLTQLVDNILDFSKIESGRKLYEFERSDLREVLADTLRTFEVRLRHQGFDVRCEMPAEPLPAVTMDAAAIAQAVTNLLDNAHKYSNGAKEILVRVGRENGWVTIAVTDSGIGISRDEQKRIFERFHRVSTGLVHDVKGSGLGLSIVNHIVQAHRGRVTVESEPGRGSTFTIHLPCADAAAEGAGARRAAGIGSAGEARGDGIPG